LIIEKIRGLAHGFKDFDHYRLRILLVADGQRPYGICQGDWGQRELKI
jgi:hypothetical protein